MRAEDDDGGTSMAEASAIETVAADAAAAAATGAEGSRAALLSLLSSTTAGLEPAAAPAMSFVSKCGSTLTNESERDGQRDAMRHRGDMMATTADDACSAVQEVSRTNAALGHLPPRASAREEADTKRTPCT